VAVPSASEQQATGKPQLGVLFVHGIGEQLQGDTLVRFGDPLARWFTRWLTRDKEVEPAQAHTSPAALWRTELVPGGSDPAHALLDVAYPGRPRGHWLLAESWWAETFRPPKTRTLLVWMLTILPYMLLEQFSVPLRRSRILQRQGLTGWGRGWARTLGFGVLLFLSLPLAALGLIAILALLVPVVIPVKPLQELAKRAAVKLASTLGDAYILTSSSVQFDAMVERVQADLHWLSARAQDVVIVAHSQGAAVTYEALRRYCVPDNLKVFVTLGQGYGKLRRVRTLRVRHRNVGYVLAWANVLAFFVVAICTTRAVTTAIESTDHTRALVLYSCAAFAGFVGLCLAFTFFWRTIKPQLFENPGELPTPNGEPLEWTNIYASADPVSNGPLCEEDSCPPWIKEIEVWNRASVVRDHTFYTEVPDDFMGCLAERLLRAWWPDDPDNDLLRARLHTARWHSWWRVWWLAFLRLASLASATADATMIFRSHKLDDIGDRVKWLEHLVGHVATPFRSALGVGTNLVGDPALTGLVIVAAGVVGAYLILAGVWSLWVHATAHDFFARPSTGTPPLGGLPFWLFLAASAQMGILAGLIGVRGDYPTDWHEVAHSWSPWVIPLPFLLAAAFAFGRRGVWFVVAVLAELGMAAGLSAHGDYPTASHDLGQGWWHGMLVSLPLACACAWLLTLVVPRPAASLEAALMRWCPVRDGYLENLSG
jgi:hypothetical protein